VRTLRLDQKSRNNGDGKTLRQDVDELSRQGNMQHANLAHGNTIANKVKIDLDVLGALVLDGVR
jgi:hypothetical protein